jgi:predicted nucleotidyltransferase
MSKELLKNIKFKSVTNSFFKSNLSKILDIILFGSSVRNKESPNDIDLLIIYKDKKNLDLSYELKKALRKNGFEVEISNITYEELISGTFSPTEGIISDGYSLIFNKFISEGLGYINFHLFRYELKELNKSTRMRFYYSLYGRTKTQKGIISELNAYKFSETILLCPSINSEKMKSFLDSWKIKYLEFPILIPLRIKSIL